MTNLGRVNIEMNDEFSSDLQVEQASGLGKRESDYSQEKSTYDLTTKLFSLPAICSSVS